MRSLIRAVADTPEGERHVSTSRELAEANGWTVLEGESAYRFDGRVREETTATGRRLKPRTTVAEAAAKKAVKATPPPTLKES